MAIVTVKNKYQVVIPQSVRDQAGVNVGDLFEAKVERGKITLTPKSLVDRRIAEGLEDIRKGREYGPYEPVAEAMDAFISRKSLSDYPADFSPMTDRNIELLTTRGEQLTSALLSFYCPES